METQEDGRMTNRGERGCQGGREERATEGREMKRVGKKYRES
jgi:hypothetical protein